MKPTRPASDRLTFLTRTIAVAHLPATAEKMRYSLNARKLFRL